MQQKTVEAIPSHPHNQARNAYNRGDFECAIDLWQSLADKGDSEAQAWIGSCFANGDGVGVDDAKALFWYEQAADQGNLLAQANVGAFYFMGRGTEKNIEKAIHWLTLAGEGGDLNGLFNLAYLYSHGEGVEQNLKLAAELYQKASELGHYPSQSRLGYMYASGEGVEKDRVQAYLWLTLASQHGIGTALEALESVVNEMSSEEKAQGAQLFDQWRILTKSHEGPVAMYPTPS